jgi:hypothetical protein
MMKREFTERYGNVGRLRVVDLAIRRGPDHEWCESEEKLNETPGHVVG